MRFLVPAPGIHKTEGNRESMLFTPEENKSISVKKHANCLLYAYLSLSWTEENSKTTKSESMTMTSGPHNPDDTQE